ncbi:Csu type fimbrial protein [Tepidicaulis sp. LMO-SS28]|uniref:Csu type fimbrial protein n=1 Tax=Tepidicaulis sp. LMO-SS28 TaxID=3447455 RepID=UPI003EE3F15C
MRMRLCFFAFALMATCAFHAPAARASCVGLGCSCEVTATGLSFGAYNPLSGIPADAAGQVSVRCSALVLGALVGYTVQLGPGLSGVASARQMSSGGHTLSYNLYADPSCTQILGDGSGATSIFSDGYLLDLLYFRTRDYTVYGRMPAGQNAAAGSYSDVLAATVVF